MKEFLTFLNDQNKLQEKKISERLSKLHKEKTKESNNSLLSHTKTTTNNLKKIPLNLNSAKEIF